jgi:hypothetical protein
LEKNKKLPQDERGTNVSLLKDKQGQREKLGQKQEDSHPATRRKLWAKTRNREITL